MKYEAKIIMLIIFLETSNIEWGQIDPEGNRRDKWICCPCSNCCVLYALRAQNNFTLPPPFRSFIIHKYNYFPVSSLGQQKNMFFCPLSQPGPNKLSDGCEKHPESVTLNIVQTFKKCVANKCSRPPRLGAWPGSSLTITHEFIHIFPPLQGQLLVVVFP